MDELSAFNPSNELEKALLQAQQGVISTEIFMQILMTSSLFVPVEDDSNVGGLQTNTKASKGL